MTISSVRFVLVGALLFFGARPFPVHGIESEVLVDGLFNQRTILLTRNAASSYIVSNRDVTHIRKEQATSEFVLKGEYVVEEGILEEASLIFDAVVSRDFTSIYLLAIGSNSSVRLITLQIGESGDLSLQGTTELLGRGEELLLSDLVVSETNDVVLVILRDGFIRFTRQFDGLLNETTVFRSNSEPGFESMFSIDVAEISKDGSYLYLTSFGATSRIFVLNIADPNRVDLVQTLEGGLVGETNGLLDVKSVRLTADNSQLLVLSGAGEALTTFARDSSTGQLAFLRSYVNDFLPVSALSNPSQLAIAPSDSTVYVSLGGSGESLAVFDRDVGTGELSNPRFPSGEFPPSLSGEGSLVTVSSNGQRVFLGQPDIGAITIFRASDPVLFSAVVPSIRSTTFGTPVSTFTAVVNGGDTTAEECRLVLEGDTPLTMRYFLTDPLSNQIVSGADEIFSVPADAVVTFALEVQSETMAPRASVNVLSACSDDVLVEPIDGVNDFSLLLSDSPRPDVLLSSVTPTMDGALSASSGELVGFSLAALNLGAPSMLKVLPRLSEEIASNFVPIAVYVCETENPSGECLAGLDVSLDRLFETGGLRTFSVFVRASGFRTLPFDPARHRVHVDFIDEIGVTRASASVSLSVTLTGSVN